MKQTRSTEIDVYENVYSCPEDSALSKFKEFIPQYFGKEADDKIKIENLLCGKDPKRISMMDLKIGKSTVTSNCKREDDKLARRIKKDAQTVSPILGYKISGFSFGNPESGEVVLSFLKKPFHSAEQTILHV